MQLEWIDIDLLKPHPKNPNRHSDEQIDRLIQIIKYQGWRHPIIAEENTNVIHAGNGRWMAAKKMGLAKVPVHFQVFESEEQAYAFLVSDNSIASWAELDLALINAEVPDLGPDFDLDLLGIKDFTLDIADKEGLCDEDEVPGLPTESMVRYGDLFILGNHRLLCGDSTNPNEVARLMNGDKADMVFTSPPYNVGIDYESHNDQMDPDSYRRLLGGVRHNLPLTDDAMIIWNKGVSIHPCDFRTDIEIIGAQYELNRVIAWIKVGTTGPPLIYHTKQSPYVKNYMPNFGFEFLFVFGKRSKGSRQIPDNVLNKRPTDVWQIDQKIGSDGKHPAAFPVELSQDVIELYCDNLLYEPFSGSGSTLIACEKTNRKCYGMEIDPHYCDVILDRWAKYTGKDPVREDGKSWEDLKSQSTQSK